MIGWMGMTNGKKQPQQMKDKELVEFATAFLNAYSATAKTEDGSSATMNKDRPYSLGPGGIVEITEEISESSTAQPSCSNLKRPMKRQYLKSPQITPTNSSPQGI